MREISVTPRAYTFLPGNGILNRMHSVILSYSGPSLFMDWSSLGDLAQQWLIEKSCARIIQIEARVKAMSSFVEEYAYESYTQSLSPLEYPNHQIRNQALVSRNCRNEAESLPAGLFGLPACNPARFPQVRL